MNRRIRKKRLKAIKPPLVRPLDVTPLVLHSAKELAKRWFHWDRLPQGVTVTVTVSPDVRSDIPSLPE